jgi:hypothetical protein
MFAKIKRFFLDENYFNQAIATLGSSRWMRAVLFALLTSLVTGQIPLGSLGPYVYWLAPLIGGAAGAVAVGDKNVIAPLVAEKMNAENPALVPQVPVV